MWLFSVNYSKVNKTQTFMWHNEKWKVFPWYPNKMHRYCELNPKCRNWCWMNFQRQVASNYYKKSDTLGKMVILQPLPYSETFWCFNKFSFSPQVKRCAIITYTCGIYELPMSCRMTQYLDLSFLWEQFFASNSHQTPSNLVYLIILITLRPFTQFQSKIRAIKLQKGAKICLNL